MTTINLNMAAKRLGITHWRVRQVYKELGITPIGYYRNSPLFSEVQLKRMAQRNVKPGPKSTKGK